MRRVREVLRLRHALGMSDRSIAQSLGIGKTTVGEYVCRAKVIGITWPVPEEIDDAELERWLFTAPSFEEKPKRPPLDWPRLHEELKRRGVTLMLLWLEYRANEPDGFGYSRFCGLYGDWRRSVSATMRQTHAAGEKLFVDFISKVQARRKRRKTISVTSQPTRHVACVTRHAQNAKPTSRCRTVAPWSTTIAPWSTTMRRVFHPRQTV